MMEQLPEGKSIGWMQAPPQWIFTHTLRFVGIVRIVIQDGEGFMLINKGKVLAYYFKHGRIELRGNAALDYFNSNPNIEFNLCKYTPEELSEALKLLNIEQPHEEEKPGAQPAPQPKKAPPAEAPEKTSTILPEPVPEEPRAAQAPPAAESENEALYEEKALPDLAEEPAPAAAPGPLPASAAVPLPAFLEEMDIKIIGQIKKLNGIVAISVFNDERNIILMGDVEIEPLLKIARNMLSTTRKITPLIDWGQFIHMTLQIPEGNIIVAPYRGHYLCLLTTRTINIGHIRRILRDILQREDHPGSL